MQRWHLSETSAEGLRKSFDEGYSSLSNSLPSGNEKLSRPLNSNTVILDYLDTSQSMMSYERESRWVELFSEFNPGRIFFFVQGEGEKRVLLPDDSELGEMLISGGVSIKGDDGRSRYSDVVFGRLRDFEPRSFVSLLRAQFQVGFRPSLAILGAPIENGIVEALIEDSSSVIFSSRYRWSAPKLFDLLFESPVQLIDLEWLQVSSWRAQLRNLAMKYDLSNAYERLEKLTIESSALHDDTIGIQEGMDASSALFVGWFVSQMKSRLRSLSSDGVECVTSSGRSWVISHKRDDSPSAFSLREVKLDFLADDKDDSPENVRIHLNAERMFETNLKCGEKNFHFTGTNRDFTPEDDLRRYFTRGESVASYRSSYAIACEVQELLGCSTKGVFRKSV